MAGDRPHGHLGARSTKLAADRAVLRTHFGRFYPFVQRLGGIPVAYFVIGAIVGRPLGWGMVFAYGIGAAIYSFLFHIYVISYFAARSRMGLVICPKGSLGYFWSSIFIPRAIFDHLVMLSALIWAGAVWFLVSGVVLYMLDYIITLTTTLAHVRLNRLKSKSPTSGAGGKKE